MANQNLLQCVFFWSTFLRTSAMSHSLLSQLGPHPNVGRAACSARAAPCRAPGAGAARGRRASLRAAALSSDGPEWSRDMATSGPSRADSAGAPAADAKGVTRLMRELGRDGDAAGVRPRRSSPVKMRAWDKCWRRRRPSSS